MPNAAKAKAKTKIEESVHARAAEAAECYGFVWPGKRAAARAALTPARLRARPRRRASLHFSDTKNIFIEGDNLEALKLLCPALQGRIQVVVIDPPYNSGKDWTYHDAFTMSRTAYAAQAGGVRPDAADAGRRHAGWLNMMYPRLLLAHALLDEGGLLAVCIDDKELLQLGMVLDEIFGASRRLACAPWRSEASGGKEKSGLRRGHEYILLYAKNNRAQVALGSPRVIDLNRVDARGAYRKGRELMKWGGTSRRADRPNQFYALRAPTGETVLPYRHDGQAGHWRWGRDNPHIVAALADPDVFHWELRPFDAGVRIDGCAERWVPYEKVRATNACIAQGTWLDNVGTNADATRELKALFGKKIFDTPKPTSLLMWIIGLHRSRSAIVLDFFAGSASTGDAVMRLNREDAGSRRFILVQRAEACPPGSIAARAGYPHIAALARERLRRVAETLQPTPASHEACAVPMDVGYRVLELI